MFAHDTHSHELNSNAEIDILDGCVGKKENREARKLHDHINVMGWSIDDIRI